VTAPLGQLVALGALSEHELQQVGGGGQRAGDSGAGAGSGPGPLALAGLVAIGLAGAAVAADRGDVGGCLVVRSLLVGAWALAGVALLTRPTLRRLGGLAVAGAAAGGMGLLAASAVHRHWSGPAGSLAGLARPLSVCLLPALALHLLLGLPDGALATRARRVGTEVGYGAGAVLGLVLWTRRPALPLWPVALLAVVVAVAGGAASHRRYLAATAVERQRLQWLGCAVAVLAEAAIVVLALRLLIDWPRGASVVLAAATGLVPAALAAGASRRLVPRADRLLVHTVAVTGLSGVVLAVYLVIVLGLGRVPGKDERSLLLLSMVAAGVAASLYLPARDRLSRFANHLVYGEREAPDEVLRTFGSRLSRAIPLDELLLQLAESLRKTMGLVAAEVWTGGVERLERAVSVPDRPPAQLSLGPKESPVVTRAGVSGPAWLSVWLPELLDGRDDVPLRMAPVTNSGELLGMIVVERGSRDESFTEEDERVLTELARQVGLALHNVQLDSALQASLDEVRRQAEELRASRARIVAASDAARRGIERNLHDGAQQHLVALAVKMRLAGQLVDADTEAAKAMLDELRTDLQAAVQELRDLAHGIYPPLLMDRGLTEALSAAAGRAALPTVVEADGVGRHPSDVEAAVYFCCLEAMQNAGKHAGEGSTITVRVAVEGDEVRFEVADDGAGFDLADRGTGAGFVNMADRVGAIGGTMLVESAPGRGTRVSGSIPVS
jgi:signal transduction histidine kinase